MNLKGFDELARHVPEFNTAGGRMKIAAYLRQYIDGTARQNGFRMMGHIAEPIR